MSQQADWKPKVRKIDDILVEGDLGYKKRDGSIGYCHVIVGRPKPTLDGKDYYCPIQAKGCFKGVKLAFGIGPLDSLMNALAVVRYYDQYLNGMIDSLPEHYERPTLRR
jgi:hypothetical protein